MTTKTKETDDLYRTTYHRDGTVTVWDVYQQQWVRMAARDVSDRMLSTFDASERARIASMLERAEREGK